MVKFAIGIELFAVTLILAEGCYLLTSDGDSFHFLGYIGAALAVTGSGFWAKILKR